MTVDDLLRTLAAIPRPRLSPFFASRATAHATAAAPPPRRAPRVMWVYWLALAFVSGPLLLTSWIGLAAVIGGAAIVASIR